MKAIVINQYGDADQLVIKDIPTPVPQQDEVLIKVKAFGINQAEIYMRKGLWGDVAKVSGIECVGFIEEDPSGEFSKGQKVAAIMGGMGRTINGSYAEYTCLPTKNVFPIETNLDWVNFAAIPESYATAWSCLHDNMNINENETIFIRGGTSALGQAAINIAANIKGITVISSTRSIERIDGLKALGCSEVFIENDLLSEKIRERYPAGIDSVMDIVGNTTLLDSLKMVKKNGTVCNAGFLGGGEPISFNPLVDMPPSVNLNFFASFMLGTDDFPISNIPMQQIVEYAEQGKYKIQPSKIFSFNQISEAHHLMESNEACGKVVIKI
ncbi:MAG: zinc-binding dehydrogenase [Gammaproteobacteria bacterium]